MIAAPWSEFDLGARIWTLPPLRHKAGKRTGEQHRVPLSDAAMKILDEMKALRINGYVFPGDAKRGTLGDAAMRRCGG